MNVIHADRAIARKLLKENERAFHDVFDSYFPRLYRDVRLHSERFAKKAQNLTRHALFNHNAFPRS